MAKIPKIVDYEGYEPESQSDWWLAVEYEGRRFEGYLKEV
jgi:hypothetical protein